MKITTIDTETTGLESQDQVIEIGMVVRSLSRPLRGFRWNSLIRPTVPVHPAARANHHVTDEELAKALTMQEFLEVHGLPGVWPDAGDGGQVVLVGHNLDFDVRMLRQSGVPDAAIPQQRICTLKCAKHLWPDAPAYGNNVLRYWLELRVEDALPPHRALPDATVTAAVLERMMQEKTVEELIALTGRPVLQTTIKFGKHSGRQWKDVDRDYLRWLLDPRRQPPFNEEVLFAARYYLENGARR